LLIDILNNRLDFYNSILLGCLLLPLLVIVEFISYLERAISLGLCLAANIISGHLLLSILSSLTYNIMSSGIIFFWIGMLP
jgi:F-type H+-transporting ATPase subunit a